MELLMPLTRQRAVCPAGAEAEIIPVILRERARWLRNQGRQVPSAVSFWTKCARRQNNAITRCPNFLSHYESSRDH
jgi:hypothetical protein